jgi:hypothetical protein
MRTPAVVIGILTLLRAGAARADDSVDYVFEEGVIGCVLYLPTLGDHIGPALGLRVAHDELVVGRSGTIDDLIARVPAVAGVALEERIGGGLRLPGAPALSRIFADEVRIGLLPHAQVDVEPVAGGNQRSTTLAATFLHDGDPGGSVAGLLRGPIARDHAWYALGADLRPGTRQLYGRVDAAVTPDHQGRVIALATEAGWPAATPSSSTVAIPRELGPGGDDADVWLDARWRSRFDHGRFEVEVGATTETMVVAGERIDRRAARLGAVRRVRAFGPHELAASLEATADDVRVDLIDRWDLRPSVRLETALRIDDEVEPRAALTWDPTGEGGGAYFVDVAPDRLTTGGQHEVTAKLLLGGAWRRVVTDDVAEETVHGWALYRGWDPGLVLRAAVSRPLVEGAPITGHLDASYRLPVCIGDLIAAAGAARADGETAGTFAFGWHPTHFLRGLDVMLAAHAGDDPAFQLTASRIW